MIVFVKTLLLTVTSMCVRAYASQCSCVFVCASVRDAQRLREKKFERLCLSICMFMCA